MHTHPLRSYRKKEDLSLEVIAAKVGVSRVSISRIERGKQTPSLDLVAKIIDATGGQLSANDFLPLRRAS